MGSLTNRHRSARFRELAGLNPCALVILSACYACVSDAAYPDHFEDVDKLGAQSYVVCIGAKGDLAKAQAWAKDLFRAPPSIDVLLGPETVPYQSRFYDGSTDVRGGYMFAKVKERVDLIISVAVGTGKDSVPATRKMFNQVKYEAESIYREQSSSMESSVELKVPEKRDGVCVLVEASSVDDAVERAVQAFSRAVNDAVSRLQGVAGFAARVGTWVATAIMLVIQYALERLPGGGVI